MVSTDNSYIALSKVSPHVAYLAFVFSYQNRFNYWLATNNLMFTDKLAKDTESFLSSAHDTILKVDSPSPASEMLQPNSTADRVALRARHCGLGWRPLTKRYLALNSLNNVMPQAIDRRTNAGFIVSGLWNSLGDVLGVAHLMTTKRLPAVFFP